MWSSLFMLYTVTGLPGPVRMVLPMTPPLFLSSWWLVLSLMLIGWERRLETSNWPQMVTFEGKGTQTRREKKNLWYAETNEFFNKSIPISHTKHKMIWLVDIQNCLWKVQFWDKGFSFQNYRSVLCERTNSLEVQLKFYVCFQSA